MSPSPNSNPPRRRRRIVFIFALPVFSWLAYNVVAGAWLELSSHAKLLNNSLGSEVTVRGAGGKMTRRGILCAADTLIADARIRFRISVISPKNVGGETVYSFYSVLLDPWEIDIVEVDDERHKLRLADDDT